MRSIAFFDLDNTLVHGSSMYQLALGAVRAGLISRRELLGFAVMELRFVVTRSERAGDRARATERALRLVRGRAATEVAGLADAVALRLVEDRCVAQTLHRLRAHQGAGDETWLVTASPLEIAMPVARLLGMTGACATRIEQRDGHYTGRLVAGHLHGPRKAEAVVRVARSRGFGLATAHAYSDSRNDLPMLQLVGHANVVNANRRLQRIARSRGWTVLTDADVDVRRVGGVWWRNRLQSASLGAGAGLPALDALSHPELQAA